MSSSLWSIICVCLLANTLACRTSSTLSRYSFSEPKALAALFVAPVIKSCETITDASRWTIDTMQRIVAKAKLPSKATIECDLPKGVPCKALP